MKLTKPILLIAALASSCFMISCEKKDAESGGSDSDSSEAVVAKDTPESLTDEMIVQMNVLGDAFVEAKDKASAEASVKKIDGIADKFDDIAARMDKLETPTEEEKKALDAKMDKASEAMQERMKTTMTAIMGNPEVAQILGPAMQKFGERMKENDKVFERFGKKK